MVDNGEGILSKELINADFPTLAEPCHGVETKNKNQYSCSGQRYHSYGSKVYIRKDLPNANDEIQKKANMIPILLKMKRKTDYVSS
jgi:hypothetical protein